MPLKRCSSGGKSGWKWGNSGKCFTGPGARGKALKQGRAIEANKSKGFVIMEKELLENQSLMDYVKEYLDKS